MDGEYWLARNGLSRVAPEYRLNGARYPQSRHTHSNGRMSDIDCDRKLASLKPFRVI